MILPFSSVNLAFFALFSSVTRLAFTEILLVRISVQANWIMKTWVTEARILMRIKYSYSVCFKSVFTSLFLLNIYTHFCDVNSFLNKLIFCSEQCLTSVPMYRKPSFLFTIFGIFHVVLIVKLADKLPVSWWADVDGNTHRAHYASMSTCTTQWWSRIHSKIKSLYHVKLKSIFINLGEEFKTTAETCK